MLYLNPLSCYYAKHHNAKNHYVTISILGIIILIVIVLSVAAPLNNGVLFQPRDAERSGKAWHPLHRRPRRFYRLHHVSIL